MASTIDGSIVPSLRFSRVGRMKTKTKTKPVKRPQHCPGTKVKTGCTTCRIRRIKCDEAKPSCLRCSSTGRTCDGYNSPLIPFDIVSQKVLCHRTFQNRKEHRSFESFRENAVTGLMEFDHGSFFWNHMVLQLSQTSPAVLHAVLALGALHDELNMSKRSRALESSIQEYNKSIRYLRSDIQQIPITLTCCALWICLEMAQNSHEAALTHLKNGLQVLHNWNTSSSIRTLERENITHLFRRLDMQATVFLNSRQPELNATSAGLQNDTASPKSFSSLQEAQICLASIEIRLLYILTTRSLWPNPIESHGDVVTAKAPFLEGLAVRFAQWKELFNDYSTRCSKDFSSKDLQKAVLLGLYYQTTTLMLDIRRSELDPKEASWLDEERTALTDMDIDGRFQRINELARSLMHSVSASGGFKLSADMGVIPPLYFSAMEGVSGQTRKQAIALLRQVKWKEGFWDAGIAATIAESVEWTNENRIEGIKVTGGIPELAKVHYWETLPAVQSV